MKTTQRILVLILTALLCLSLLPAVSLADSDSAADDMADAVTDTIAASDDYELPVLTANTPAPQEPLPREPEPALSEPEPAAPMPASPVSEPDPAAPMPEFPVFEPEPALPAPAVTISDDGETAVVTGDFTDLYVRVALVLENNGVSGLYVTQASIVTGTDDIGSITVPPLLIPGIKVTAVNIALVPSLNDITSATPSVVAAGFSYLEEETPAPTAEPVSTPEPTAEPSATPAPTPEPTPTPYTGDTRFTDNTLEVHFIDVGQADAILLLCGDEAMLIDGGNVADSDLIYTYLKNYSVDYLDYVVGTHAHEDHIGGLAGALNYATAGTVYCSVSSYNTRAFASFAAAVEKQGKEIEVPSPGDTWTLGDESDGLYAAVEVIGPITMGDDVNAQSIVLRVEYGGVSFLFTGDATRDEEAEILDAGYNVSSTVLKVGHHGSSTSTSYPWLYAVEPQYAVISVGTDNDYGHPNDATLSRLRDADVTVYRTDLQGDIICVTDGSGVTFSVDRNADIDTLASVRNPADQEVKTYVLNTKTMKFHDPACSSVEQMREENKEIFVGTRGELIDMGYSPCGNCRP